VVIVGAGDQADVGQAAEVGTGGLVVDLQGAGELSPAGGLVQAEQEHEHDRGALK